MPSRPAPRTAPPWRTAMLALLGSLAFVLVLGAGLASGIGGALIAFGLMLFLVGLGALAFGSVRWAFITSRRAGAVVLAAGLVVTITGGAVVPPEDVAPTAVQDDALVAPTRTASVVEPTATSATAPSTTEPAPSASPTPGAASPALALLGILEVKGRAAKTGYDRDLFGQAWADTDRNGCDTRNDILRRDLTGTDLKAGTNGCVVATGTLTDPFSGKAIAFVRGQRTSSAVQIDHVVALSDAWQKGAQQWTPQRRVAFANDPLNLLAVDGPLNAQKGDGDAATWLPPNKGFRCDYVARQVAVKAKYGAWVTAAERDAVARVLSGCPGQGVPTSDAATESSVGSATAPAAAPAAPPAAPAPGAAAPVAPSTCDPSYPGVCIAPVGVAGDLDCKDVPHKRFAVLPPDPHGFDGNSDGVGCES